MFWHSVKAWRGLRYNQDYALKLERKSAGKRPRGATQSELDARNKHQAVNPFAVRSSELTLVKLNALR